MLEKTHTLRVKVPKTPKTPLKFHLGKDRTSALEFWSSNNPDSVQSAPSGQPTSRELILHLIEALKEL
jgi:hypothetical protein